MPTYYKTNDGKIFDSNNAAGAYETRKEGKRLIDLGDYDNAISVLSDAIKYARGSGSGGNITYTYYLRGFAYEAKGDYENAINDYTCAIKAVFDSRDAETCKECKERIEKLIKLHSNSSVAVSYNQKKQNLIRDYENKIVQNIENNGSLFQIWSTARLWENETGRKMTKEEQIRIAGKPFPSVENEDDDDDEDSSTNKRKKGKGGVVVVVIILIAALYFGRGFLLNKLDGLKNIIFNKIEQITEE